MSNNTKDWIQYGSAIAMLVSGVILTFLCFFLNNHKIDDSVLWYMAQALVYAGSIFGVSIYMHTKLGEAKSDLEKYIQNNVLKSENKDGN